MGAFTVNMIFDLLQERKAVEGPGRGRARFGRRERVDAVFPERICAMLASRSASYYSWFLNMDRQAAPIRDSLRTLFEEDTQEVVREMTEKCGRLLGGPESGTGISADAWRDLLDLLGREVPVFVRGSDGAQRLARLTQAAPQRALACLFLAAGMNGFTPEQYEQLLGSWRLMNRYDIPSEAEEPLRRLQAGELLYLDGSRKEALQQLELAAEKLRDPAKDREPDRELLGRILLRLGEMRMGEMRLQGDGQEAEETSARDCLRESVQYGCVEANAPLAVLELKNGGTQAAREALLRGAQAGIPECLRMLGNSFYRGDGLSGYKRDLRKAAACYRKGAGPEDPASGDAVCQYMLGRILEEDPSVLKADGTGGTGRRIPEGLSGAEADPEWIPEGFSGAEADPEGFSGAETDPEWIPEGFSGAETDPEWISEGFSGAETDPEYWYAAAARQGNAEAAARLGRLRWHAFGTDPFLRGKDAEREQTTDPNGRFSDDQHAPEAGRAAAHDCCAAAEDHFTGVMTAGKRFCLFNSLSEKNRLFAQTLPEGAYTVFFCTAQAEGSGGWKTGAWPSFPFKNSAAEGGGSAAGAAAGGGAGADTRETKAGGPGSRPVRFAGTMAQALYRIGLRCLEEAETHAADASQWLLESFPEILCVAFDEMEEKNMQDGLQVLRTAFLLHEKTGIFGKLPAARPGSGSPDVKPGELRLAQEPPSARPGSGFPGEDAGAGKTCIPEKEKEDTLFYLLSGRVKLYVLGQEECAAPVFDSACSRLGDFYLPLFLCDRAKMTSAWLLDRIPLFIPCLRKKENESSVREEDSFRKDSPFPMNVAVFGDHPGIVQLCKDIIASAQIEDAERFPFSLTVIGENADLLEEKLLTDCPGIADPPEGVVLEAPLFVRMRPESRQFQGFLADLHGSGREHTGDEELLAQRLRSAGCLIVYAKDGSRNLSLSMYLREWYLKTDPAFARLPLIAAYCEETGRADQMRTLTAGAEEAGFSWFNNYRIEPFGTTDRLFSYEAIVRNRVEQCAMALHFTYYTFTSEADRFRAEHDYFYRNYNRDSSLMNALALPYRLFSAGIAFSDWHDYAAEVSRERLARQFEDWLEIRDRQGEERETAGRREGMPGQPQEEKGADRVIEEMTRRLERLAAYEHGRWNRYMLSRGWLPASMEQMLAYIQRGNARHQLYIAKLHPFICSWECLGEAGGAPTGIQKEFNSIMRQVHPDKTPMDIRGIDRENVRRTAAILRAGESINESTGTVLRDSSK